MTKVSFTGSGTLVRTPFPYPLSSYSFINDGASTIVVELDDAPFNVLAGETVENSAGERLASLRVATNAGAASWRFLGDA